MILSVARPTVSLLAKLKASQANSILHRMLPCAASLVASAKAAAHLHWEDSDKGVPTCLIRITPMVQRFANEANEVFRLPILVSLHSQQTQQQVPTAIVSETTR